MNWNKILCFAVTLFLTEVLVGFITGGEDWAQHRLAVSSALSLAFSTVLFWVMATNQHRPFLHACLALLLTFVFSLALGAFLPAWLAESPLILVALEWLTLALGLVIGTSIGRYIGLRSAKADA